MSKMVNIKQKKIANKKIVIFASGGGSNAESILHYFKSNPIVEIRSFFINNPRAFVIERAKQHNIPYSIFTREEYQNGKVLDQLKSINPDLIVLAGFLWLIPTNFVKQFPNKIINIHPALLPNYGGKGMYGMNVHKAVKEASETESGMTIHYVNEKYDEGNIIFQGRCSIDRQDTIQDIAAKVLKLEHKHYPKEIEKLLK